LNDDLLALDSWVTIGAASETLWGVPRAFDPDGSVLQCPPYPMSTPGSTMVTRPLCTTDGLLAKDSVPQVVNFRFEPGYLGRIRGSVLHTMDGAWGVLGGTKGPTEDNILLVAQITTNGTLSFKLNVQVGTAEGAVKYVSTEAGAEEVLHPGLRYGDLP
jgi:hypothetical protein